MINKVNKFDVGDTVTVKNDLKIGEKYDGMTFLESMLGGINIPIKVASVQTYPMLGKSATYLLENGFYYSEEMLCEYTDKKAINTKTDVYIDNLLAMLAESSEMFGDLIFVEDVSKFLQNEVGMTQEDALRFARRHLTNVKRLFYDT